MTESMSARELLVEVRAILRIPPYSVQFDGALHNAYSDVVIVELIDHINLYMSGSIKND